MIKNILGEQRRRRYGGWLPPQPYSILVGRGCRVLGKERRGDMIIRSGCHFHRGNRIALSSHITKFVFEICIWFCLNPVRIWFRMYLAVRAIGCWVSRRGKDMGGGCHQRETALPDRELAEPSQLPDHKLTHPSYPGQQHLKSCPIRK